jgi:hypothetical protein
MPNDGIDVGMPDPTIKAAPRSAVPGIAQVKGATPPKLKTPPPPPKVPVRQARKVQVSKSVAPRRTFGGRSW